MTCEAGPAPRMTTPPQDLHLLAGCSQRPVVPLGPWIMLFSNVPLDVTITHQKLRSLGKTVTSTTYSKRTQAKKLFT